MYSGYEKGTCVEEDLVISIIKVQIVILVRNGKESRMRKREKVWPQNASGQPHWKQNNRLCATPAVWTILPEGRETKWK